MGWYELAQDRYQWPALVYTVMSLGVPQNIRKFLRSLEASRELLSSMELVRYLFPELITSFIVDSVVVRNVNFKHTQIIYFGLYYDP
jgi:hypothetical protein